MRERKSLKTIYGLLFNSGTAVQLVSLITLYRIVTAPLLLFLTFTGHMDIFKWLLLASFSTDAIDGHLARKYNARSILGAKLDSIGDDLTILVAIIALFNTHFYFISEQVVLFSAMLGFFFLQLAYALYKYKKATSFHTYLAKTAAVLQAAFILSTFFFDTVFYPVFFLAAGVTIIELIEEIIIVRLLPKWEADVKGLYWVYKFRKKQN